MTKDPRIGGGAKMDIGKNIPVLKGLIDEFENLSTSTIGPILDDLNIQGIIQNIKPLSTEFRFVGRAVTVKEVTGVLGTYTSEEFGMGPVIDSSQKGDVIVIDNGGHQVSTWGGTASFAAKMRGVRGLVVDGGVRDFDEILKFQFPVFSRHVVPTTGKTRVKVISINTTIKIDGIRIRPGDILVGDSTGIVCIPIEVGKKVATIAKKLDRQDKEALREIRKGLSFTEALRKFKKM